jgi:16S rRNA (guanine527-N7)-methyltransferase
VVFQLKLSNVQPVKSRVEDYQGETAFDGVLSRAFSSLNDMVSWCSHLITNEHGQFFALKGQYPADEITQLPENIRLVSSHEIKVPELVGERHVLILEKTGKKVG